MTDLDVETQTKIEAAVFRRLVEHLDANKAVQNIDLMLLAGFCRNCLSKWYVAAGKDLGLTLDLEDARQQIYGMPYADWKDRYQEPVPAEKLQRFEAARKK